MANKNTLINKYKLKRKVTNQEEIFAIWIIKQISLIYKEPTEKNKKKNEQPSRIKSKGYEKTV